jgi:predicted amidohydrolase YtcJ
LPGRRVLLRRVDGHAAWASPSALAEAGIVAATPDPPGGRIVRDPQGRPNGVLIDAAVELVKPPPPSTTELRRRMQGALVVLAAGGLTGVHMMGADDGAVALLEDLSREDRLPIRLWVYVDADSQAAARLVSTGPWGEGRLRFVGVKVYADGALGSRGALLSAPYADEPGTAGLALYSGDEIETLATAMLATGAQSAVHAIGDLAVTRVLDAFARVRAAHPSRSTVPLRIEHAQVVRPSDRPRFRELNVFASMQPTHAINDAPWAERRLGPERVRWGYAWRSLLDAGALLAFGSDAPGESSDPGPGLLAATRRGGWHPEQAVTLDQAIAGFTSGAARAVQAEDRFGTLAVGRPADLTLWSVTGEPWVAVGTVVGGEVVSRP